MNQIPNSLPEPIVQCPSCQSKSWTIFSHRVQCCRCGLSYATPNICHIQTMLIPQSVPSKEVVDSLKIFEGKE